MDAVDFEWNVPEMIKKSLAAAVVLGGLTALGQPYPCQADPTNDLLFDLTTSFVLDPADPGKILSVFWDEETGKWCSVSYKRDDTSNGSHYRTGASVPPNIPPTVNSDGFPTAFFATGNYGYGRIANKHTLLPICPGDNQDPPSTTWSGVNLVQNGGSGQLIVKSGPASAPANRIIINAPVPGTSGSASGVDMFEDNRQNLLKYFGGNNAFAKAVNPSTVAQGLKITQYIALKCLPPGCIYSKTDPGIRVTFYDKLNFQLNVTPIDNQTVKTDCFSAPPQQQWPHYDNAVRCPQVQDSTHVGGDYATSPSANDFRMVLGNVTWKAPECDGYSGGATGEYAYCAQFDDKTDHCGQAITQDNPVDSSLKCLDIYKARFFYVSFPLFQHSSSNIEPGHTDDDGVVRPFYTDDLTNIHFDGQTGAAIYKVDLRPYLIDSPGATSNPLASASYQNVLVHLQGDLEELLVNHAIKNTRIAYDDSLSRLPLESAIPPRLCAISNNGVVDKKFCKDSSKPRELWAVYATHFYINVVQVGFEVEGQSALRFKVNELKIMGCKPCN